MSQLNKTVIVGCGLSGLACALTLKSRNIPFLLVDKNTYAGGRVYSDRPSDGFIYDRGFQVLLNSYPELNRFFDLKSLKLNYFHSGAMIYTPEKMRLLANPILHPSFLLSETLSTQVSLKDKALVIGLVAKSHAISDPSKYVQQTTRSFLTDFGFSEEFINFFWQPFLSGVFLETQLETRADYFIFLMKCFSTGLVSVPAMGMRALPEQLLTKIDKSEIKLGAEVAHVKANQIVLKDGSVIEAQAVVCAYPQTSASSEFRSTTVYYFEIEDDIEIDKWLLLVPSQYGFKVNNISYLSKIAPSYAPAGRKLISATTIGPTEYSPELIAQELTQILSLKKSLTFLNQQHIAQALPVYRAQQESKDYYRNGIYHCGDSISTPSINGALESGRKVAELIMRDVYGVTNAQTLDA